MDNKKYNHEKKSVNLSVRCTPKLEDRIKSKSRQLDMSVSEFVSNCIEGGLARKTKYDRHKARALVEMQIKLDQIILRLSPEQKDIKEQLIGFARNEVMELWDI